MALTLMGARYSWGIVAEWLDIKMLSLLIKNMIYQLNAMMKKKHEPYEKIYKKIMF